jgi:hypothetical protein
MSLFSSRRGAWSGRRNAPPISRPRAHFQMNEQPQCAFCSKPSVTRCEYPGCDVPVCARCRVRKGGGNLCRRHKGAHLEQVPGLPMVADVAVRGLPSKRFRAKGPAVPHAE